MAVFYANSGGRLGLGDGSSEPNACLATDFTSNSAFLYQPAAAGDTCWVKNGTEITFASLTDGNLFEPSFSGSANAPVRMAGYATTPGDGGMVEIRDTDEGLGASAVFSFSGDSFWIIENFKTTRCRRHTRIETSANGIVVRNCVSIDSESYGFDSQGGTGNAPTMFIDCLAQGTVNEDGFYALWRNARLIRCVSVGNNANGFYIGNAYGAILDRCVAHANGQAGFHCVNTGCVLSHCVANGNDGDGFEIDQLAQIIASVASNNGGYGVRLGTNHVYAIGCALNPTNAANTSGLKVGTGDLIEVDAITGDPLFEDDSPATATDIDLRTQSGSALRAAITRLGGDGFASVVNALDAGAYQASGGGGSPVTRGWAI